MKSKKRTAQSDEPKKEVNKQQDSAPIEVQNKKKQKKDSQSSQINTASDTIYLGHVPSGFYEKEIKSFFNQFGDVRRVKLFRSEKTGASKGYAFIQFVSSDIPPIVAEAIHGYFLSDRQLVCNVVPTSKCHEGMFLPPQKKEVTEKVSDESTSEMKAEKRIRRITRLQKTKMNRLKELGIDFDI